MTKFGKIIYYLLAVLAIVNLVTAFINISDSAVFTRNMIMGCFCLLMSIWTFVDSKVDL